MTLNVNVCHPSEGNSVNMESSVRRKNVKTMAHAQKGHILWCVTVLLDLKVSFYLYETKLEVVGLTQQLSKKLFH